MDLKYAKLHDDFHTMCSSLNTKLKDLAKQLVDPLQPRP